MHPSFAVPIASTLHRLRERYGVDARVKLHEPDSCDRSMAYTEGTTIHLNPFWFDSPITVLRSAAAMGNVRGDPTATLWHGGMVDEPTHVVTHEFFHALWNVRLHREPGFREFVSGGYERALADPALAVSGYALANPDEWLAETFSAAELGLDGNAQVDTARALLERLQ